MPLIRASSMPPLFGDNSKQRNPFLKAAAPDWITHTNKHGNGYGEHKDVDENEAPKVAPLGRNGTSVKSAKLLLPVSWHAVFSPKQSTSTFSAFEEIQRANLQDYNNQAEIICPNFGGHHSLCVWLTATVQIQKAVIIIKESGVLQGGRFILELVEIETDVAIANVVSTLPRA